MAGESTRAETERVMYLLFNAAYRHGYELEEIEELASHRMLLPKALAFLRREREERRAFIINRGKDPFLPRGWSVITHRREASIEWNPNAVELHFIEEQRAGSLVEARLIRERVKTMSALNLNALDFLFENRHLIPEMWKERVGGCYPLIHFWGTIARTNTGEEVVFYLVWDGKRWERGYSSLSTKWFRHTPAAVHLLSAA